MNKLVQPKAAPEATEITGNRLLEREIIWGAETLEIVFFLGPKIEHPPAHKIYSSPCLAEASKWPSQCRHCSREFALWVDGVDR